MYRVSMLAVAFAFVTFPSSAFAQNAYTKAAQAQFDGIKANLVKTAAKVPEELYSFKPTPEVRSMGELIGHVADANFLICSTAAGEKPPQGGFEKKTSKAEISKGLDDSIAYCDKVIASLDDAKGTAPVTLFGMTMPKVSVIYFNVEHCNEHYGNLVTYMRLKNIVPPSSERSR
jgi:uncharacterized damage-inducible protein DinB